MLGYLYKDLRVSIINLICIAMLGVLAAALTLFAGYEYEPQEGEALACRVIFIVNLFLPLVAMYIVYAADAKERWVQYALSLPGGIKRYVKSKYLFVAAFLLFGAVYAVLLSVIFNTVFHYNYMTGSVLYFILMADAIGIILTSLYIPVVFRFGAEVGNAISSGIVILCLILVYCLVLFGNLSEEGVYDKLFGDLPIDEMGNSIIIFFLLSIAIMYFSYKISVNVFMRGISEEN